MWSEAEYSGLLEMATGAGKTITAIQGVSELESALGHELPVIILVPSKALVDQWYDEVSKFLPHRIVVCTSGKRVDREWRTVLRVRLAMFSAGNCQASPILIGVLRDCSEAIEVMEGRKPQACQSTGTVFTYS